MDTKLPTNDAILNIENIRFSISHTNKVTEPDAPELFGPHIHSSYEFYINVAGDISFLVNNRIYNISSGDIIMAKPGDVHHCICNTTCLHEHFCMWFDDENESPLTEFIRKSESPYLNMENEETRQVLFSMLRQLHSLYNSENSLSKTAALISIFDFIATRGRVTASNNDNIPIQLQQILDYMNNNFTEIEQVSNITDEFFISTATLNRWFRRYIHLSPHEFLEAKKLSYAKLLLQKGFNVTDVGEKAGFSDASHFIAVFKKRFGKTPHKYKQTVT